MSAVSNKSRITGNLSGVQNLENYLVKWSDEEIT